MGEPLEFRSYLVKELRSRGGSNHPPWHFTFFYRFTWERNFSEISAPKDVEVCSPEVYGSVPEKFAHKKIWRLKNTGGGW